MESERGYRWRAYLADNSENGEPEEVVLVYCPACAEREFGPIEPSRPDERAL